MSRELPSAPQALFPLIHSTDPPARLGPECHGSRVDSDRVSRISAAPARGAAGVRELRPRRGPRLPLLGTSSPAWPVLGSSGPPPAGRRAQPGSREHRCTLTGCRAPCLQSPAAPPPRERTPSRSCTDAGRAPARAVAPLTDEQRGAAGGVGGGAGLWLPPAAPPGQRRAVRPAGRAGASTSCGSPGRPCGAPGSRDPAPPVDTPAG